MCALFKDFGSIPWLELGSDGMAIIIDKDGRRIYRTLGYMAYEDKKRADKLDDFLKREVSQIEERLATDGLLDLKGKPGAVKLWFNVGLELRKLWGKVIRDFQLPDTLITIFLKAVYDNSKRMKPASSRAKRLGNSLFYYCYLISGLPWEMVEASGNWGEWSDFLDSKRIRDDPRIVNWFIDRKVMDYRNERKLTRHKWFKRITKVIRNDLRHIDTTALEKNELYEKLDKILLEAVSK
jgi:hypothetical protein